MEAVRGNLSQARFRFVVLMDRLDDRLKTLISFVNANSRFDVYGSSSISTSMTSFEIIIPTLYGAETKNQIAGAGASQKRDVGSFFADAELHRAGASNCRLAEDAELGQELRGQ